MPWYYASQGERFGPFDDAQFRGLVGQGTVRDDTLVWRDGMENWQPFSEVSAATTPSAAPARRGGEEYGAGTEQPMVVCSSCGNLFRSDEVIQYQGAYICATCKPTFVQQIKEGGRVLGQMEYGGFWIRFVATIVDGILLNIINLVVNGALGMILSAADPSTAEVIMVFAQIILSLTYIAYEVFFLGRFGATPGKMVCRLKVVTAEGQPITYLRALARVFAEILSGCTLMIGYIIAAFDDEKRALHDHICSTRVIKV